MTGMQIVGLDTIGKLKSRLLAIHNMGERLGELMEYWERVIEKGNTRGILAGTDKDGNPAEPLRYRPKSRIGEYNVTVAGRKLTTAQRLGQRPNKRRGKYAGKGAYKGLLDNNNLTTAEYQLLDGPRLAPRRQFSRSITNFATAHYQTQDPNIWVATGAWIEVFNPDGEPFLHFHFDGLVPNARAYDLRGVRPDDMAELKESLIRWAKLQIRENYRGMRNDPSLAI